MPSLCGEKLRKVKSEKQIIKTPNLAELKRE